MLVLYRLAGTQFTLSLAGKEIFEAFLPAAQKRSRQLPIAVSAMQISRNSAFPFFRCQKSTRIGVMITCGIEAHQSGDAMNIYVLGGEILLHFSCCERVQCFSSGDC